MSFCAGKCCLPKWNNNYWIVSNRTKYIIYSSSFQIVGQKCKNPIPYKSLLLHFEGIYFESFINWIRINNFVREKNILL